jgi:adhesin/invasin
MRLLALPQRHLGELALALLVTGCGSDSLVLPGEGAPAKINIMEGNEQQGRAGSPLADSLRISVTDEENRPVVSRDVAFRIIGGGDIAPGVVRTDSSGTASFRWILGPSAGAQELEVGLGTTSQLAPKVTFTAIATAGPVQAIDVLSGDNQTAPAGSPLPQPLVVRLLDTFGNPVEGEDVVWQASAGSLNRTTVTTDADGSASVAWTLGSTPGAQTASARFPGASGSPITFNATATPGASPRLAIVTQPSPTAESGVTLARQPAVRLETAGGNPILKSGVAVTAAIVTGGGTLSGTTTVQTNSSGVAQFTNLTISGTSGKRTLIFAAVGHTAAISAPVDLLTPSVSASRSTISASPTTIQAGNGQSTITVTARDAAGKPIAGLPVQLAASGSGNSLVQPAALTNANGVATGTFSSTVAGTKSIAAQIGTTSVSETATVTVVSAGPSPVHSTANVPGSGRRFQWVTITIRTRDALGNNITQGGYASQILVSVSGANTDLSLSIFDQGDGTYEASYFPLFSGTDQVAVTINGAPLQGSPFRIKIK